MKLHENYELFESYISLASQEEDIDEAIIIKDYYVVLALKKLYEIDDNLVFIGGTSLSKCFNIIKRFSEDIDLVATANTRKSKQKQTYNAVQYIKASWDGLVEEDNRLTSDFKEMYLHYDSIHNSDLDQRIKIELLSFMDPFPIIMKGVVPIIFKYLEYSEKEEYQIFPVEVKTQEPYRTLLEKILLEKELYKEFLEGKLSDESQAKRARDFYDIHKIWNYYNKKLPFNQNELNTMINSRIKNRRNKTTISGSEFTEYLLDEMYNKRNISKQLSEVDFRKLSIRDLNVEDISKSLFEIDVYFANIINR